MPAITVSNIRCIIPIWRSFLVCAVLYARHYGFKYTLHYSNMAHFSCLRSSNAQNSNQTGSVLSGKFYKLLKIINKIRINVNKILKYFDFLFKLNKI